MARKNRKPIYVLVLALILLYVVIYTIPQLTGVLARTEILKQGAVQVTEEADCCFVRTEKVYSSNEEGSLKYRVKEGIHIRKGTKVVELTQKQISDPADKQDSEYQEMIDRLGKKAILSINFKAKDSGVLSYYADGYEGFFKPETMRKLKYDDIKKLKAVPEHLKRDTTLRGEPVFKICDNDSWYLVCWVEAGSAGYYEPGNTVTFQLPDGEVKAQVEEVNRADDRWQVIFRSNRYYKSFAKSRIVRGEIISKEYDGLIASNSSLTTENGKAGLMVRKKNGNYGFVPVKVIASDGEYSALAETYFIDEDGERQSTVKVYDEVLKHPGK